jgi:HK97 family phage portal protein
MNVFKLAETTTGFIGLNTPFIGKRISHEQILRDGFLSNDDVFSIVSRLSRLCANTPIKLMNGEEVVPDTDPIYNRFYDNWNSKYGLKESLYQYYTNLLLFGVSYIYDKSDTIGFVSDEQWILPSQNVTPSSYTNSLFDEPRYYQFNDGSKTLNILPEQLIITRYYDPSLYNNQGLSPLQSVWKTVESSNNRASAESSMLENRGISGFISPKANSGDAAAIGFSNKVMDVVRAAFTNLTGGAKKFNKIEIIESGAEFTQLGMDANDMKIIEMRLNHVRAICNSYGVPSLLFNDYQSRTHANYENAMKAMYTDAVIPNVELFKNQYEKKFLNKLNLFTGQKYWLRIAVEEIESLKADLKELRTAVLSQLEKSLITRSEARELLGYPSEMPKESIQGIELLRSLSPLLANGLISTLSEEDKQKLLIEAGLINIT